MSILQLYQFEFRNPNLWQFEFVNEIGSPVLDNSKFLVQSVPLDFIQFETETRVTGTKSYQAVQWVEDIEITFLETRNLDVYNFHIAWRDTFYDSVEKRFKSFATSASKPTKNAVLTYTKFVNEKTQIVKSWQFKNLMLKAISGIQNNYENTDNQVLTVTYTPEEIIEEKSTF